MRRITKASQYAAYDTAAATVARTIRVITTDIMAQWCGSPAQVQCGAVKRLRPCIILPDTSCNGALVIMILCLQPALHSTIDMHMPDA